MLALVIYAGPSARAKLAQDGLQPHHVGTIAAAAGGPKGLILGALDRFIFGEWLLKSNQCVDLVGASIGAWRMSTACLEQPVAALKLLEHNYIRQHYELLPGEKRPSAERVSALFGQNLQAFYGDHLSEVLHHSRYRLHVLTSHGRGLLAHAHAWRTPLGFAGAFLSNLIHRKALGGWLERVVFSSHLPLPFDPGDYPTLQVALTQENFFAAVQASCSIPFVLQAVHDIAGAPPGAYWDGGVTDYHLHLNYARLQKTTELIAAGAYSESVSAINRSIDRGSLVLYPHFQQSVIPGWLDKHLRWRHAATPFLDNMVLLAPNPEWVKTLPNGKLPDRGDFTHYGADLSARVKAWTTAVAASAQLVDEFEGWLARPDMGRVQVL